jgi:hypothetical protein
MAKTVFSGLGEQLGGPKLDPQLVHLRRRSGRHLPSCLRRCGAGLHAYRITLWKQITRDIVLDAPSPGCGRYWCVDEGVDRAGEGEEGAQAPKQEFELTEIEERNKQTHESNFGGRWMRRDESFFGEEFRKPNFGECRRMMVAVHRADFRGEDVIVLAKTTKPAACILRYLTVQRPEPSANFDAA